MKQNSPQPLLSDEEQHYLIPGPLEGMRLFIRRLQATGPSREESVLYVHGATFPSALSVAHRFDGRSWRDELCGAGFDVWAFDFYGFGGSDRYPQMTHPSDGSAPLGMAIDAMEQLSAVVAFILATDHRTSLSIVSHSWGSLPVGLYSANHAPSVKKWVMFAPLAQRESTRDETVPHTTAWRTVSIEDQWTRFVEDVPANEPPVLRRSHFDLWAPAYLASDPEAGARMPPAVKVPGGPFFEIQRALQGHLAYDPSTVAVPIAIIRGEWDGLLTDDDARWLFDAFTQAPHKRDIKIGRGTHLMHLEDMRFAVWSESISFLVDGTTPPKTS